MRKMMAILMIIAASNIQVSWTLEETGYDFPGNDLDKAWKDLKEDCKSWCESLNDCTRWLFIEGRSGTNCWLKYGDMASQNKTREEYDVTDQTAYSEHLTKEEKMAEVTGFDYPCSGCDIHIGEGGTKEHCKYYCELREECTRWLFIEGVDSVDGRGKCWLKKWNPEKKKYGGGGSIYSARVIQCSEKNPCGIDEGDCDNHSQCVGSLVCGIQNCVNKFEGFGFKDCCFQLPKGRSQVCRGGDNCCKGKCLENEGDCDTNSDCMEPLVCGSDNCRSGTGSSFGGDDDCCYTPKSAECGLYKILKIDYSRPLPKNAILRVRGGVDVYWRRYWKNGEFTKNADPEGNCCKGSNRCAIGEGDCDTDSDCQDGLKCGNNNCDWKVAGMHWKNDDCCVRA